MTTPDQLRRELAGRAGQILPAGFTASPMDDGIWLDAPDGFGIDRQHETR